MQTFSIGLIGFGTIGSFIARRLRDHPSIRIGYVVTSARGVATAQHSLPGVAVSADLDLAMRTEVDLVVEAASPVIARQAVPAALERTDVLPFTLTILADPDIENAVMK